MRLVSCLIVPIQILSICPREAIAATARPTQGEPEAHGFSNNPPHGQISGVKPNRTLPAVPPVGFAQLSETPSDAELFAAHIFLEPLVPVGGKTSPEANQALASAIKAFLESNDLEQTGPLTSFLERFPRSAWRASLLANLGAIYRVTGYWSQALNAWEESWAMLVNGSDPRTKALGDYVLGEMAQLNARLGRADRLESLFSQIGDRDVRGAATEKIAGARQGLSLMRTQPQNAFRCGPMT